MAPTAPVQDPFVALLDPGTLLDPYAAYDAIRATGPVLRSSTGQWVVSSFAAVDEVLNDVRYSSDMRRATGVPAMPDDSFTRLAFQMMIVRDSPDHERLRLLVNKAFRPHTVRHLHGTIQAACDELLDAVAPAGRMDVISDLAFPLPVKVICAILGVPREDTPKLRSMSDRVSAMLDPTKVDIPEVRAAALEAGDEFAEYFGDLSARRNADPQDDLVTALVHAEHEGERLSHEELLGNLMLLMVAGHETTANLIANSVRLFLMHPDQWALVTEDPAARADGAAEECLRFDGPLQIRVRTATEELELAGTTIPAGEVLILLLGAANHDPEQFPEPGRFDVTRSFERHFAHGDGIHYCLGAALSREEAKIVYQTLATRFASIEAEADPATLPRHDSLAVRGVATLPLRFSPAS